MKNLFDFCCRIEQRLLSMGFEFHYQSPDSGSRYYYKPVTKYHWGNGTYKEIGKVLIVRLSDHHIPEYPDGTRRGSHHYEFIHSELEETTEDTFDSISSYS